MNISGIPQLQTAAGLSIGEVVVPAEGHRNMTHAGEGGRTLLATAAMHCAQWEEHVNASIWDGDRLEYCST